MQALYTRLVHHVGVVMGIMRNITVMNKLAQHSRLETHISLSRRHPQRHSKIILQIHDIRQFFYTAGNPWISGLFRRRRWRRCPPPPPPPFPAITPDHHPTAPRMTWPVDETFAVRGNTKVTELNHSQQNTREGDRSGVSHGGSW